MLLIILNLKGYFSGTSVSSGSGTIIKEDSNKYYVFCQLKRGMI